MIDAQSAHKADLETGETVKVASDGKAQRAFQIVGISTFGNVRSLGTADDRGVRPATAQPLFGKQGRLDTVLARRQAGRATAPRCAPAWTACPRSTVFARPPLRTASRSRAEAVRRASCADPALLGIVAVLVGAFTIANALAMSVAQQQRSLALLRAVGASRRQVRRLVAFRRSRSASSGRCSASPAGFASHTRSARCSTCSAWALPMTAMSLTAAP